MIDQKQKYQAYAAATQTVARTKQIVMLYDGAIRFLQHAREAIQQNRIEERYNMLCKASEVLIGLQSCLDFDNGGKVARVLYGFYSSMDNLIFQVQRNNSLETCDTIIADMKKMRDVWHEIDESDAGPGPAPAPSSAPTGSTPPPASDQSFTLSA